MTEASAAARRTVTVGGPSGTGTTTACRGLAQRTGLKYQDTGRIFRGMAQERRMSLEAFGRYAETHPDVDRHLDDRQIALLRKGPLLLEGRLSGWLAHREKIPVFKVWFMADPRVRAQRIANREGGNASDRLQAMERREASERKRYREIYGFDLSDTSFYDLVLDTSAMSPEEVVEAVWKSYVRSSQPRRWYEFWKR